MSPSNEETSILPDQIVQMPPEPVEEVLLSPTSDFKTMITKVNE